MANDLVVQLGAKLDQFASDMNQAGDIADSAVGRIENSFANLNPGLGLSALGEIAAGAAAGVTALLAVLQNVNGELAAIAKNAEYTGVSVERFQSLQFAATQGGVSPEQSTTDLRNVARLLADAKENENSLTKLLDTNNIKYVDRNDDVIGLNKLLTIAGDLINRFHSMPEKVEAAKALGLSEQWVQALKNGSKAFDDVANSAEGAGAVIDKTTIAKAEAFDAAWKKSAALLSSQFKAVTGDIASWLDGLIDKGADFISALAKSQGATPGGGQEKFNAIADALDVARKDASGLAQDFDQVNKVLERYKGLASADPEIIAGLEAVRSKAKAIADEAERAAKAFSSENFPSGVPTPASRPSSADDTTDKDAKLTHRKSDDDNKDNFDRSVEQSNRRIALVNAETASIGQNTEFRERAKIVAELEEAAKRANAQAGEQLYGVTEKTNPKIGEQADKMLAAAKAAREQQTSFAGLNESIRFGGNELVNVLDQATQKGFSFRDAMATVMRDVSKQMLQAAITGEGAFAKLFGFSSANGGVGGLGGLLANAFGGGADPGSAARPLAGLTAADYAPGFASGTDSAPGGMAWVGENGKELMNVPRGAQIIPNDVLKSGAGNGVVMNDNRSISIGAGVSPAEVRAILAEDRTRRYADTLQIVADARSRGRL